MDVHLDSTTPGHQCVRVTIDAKLVADDLKNVIAEFKSAPVPGFRPGKAPTALVQKRYHKEILDQAGKQAAIRLLEEILQERNIRRAGPTSFSSIQYDPDTTLAFEAEFDLLPDFELPDYHKFAPAPDRADPPIDQLSEFLLEQTPFKAPESLVQQELELAGAENSPEARAAAEQRVRLLLILQKIAETDGIEIDARDLEDRIQSMAYSGGVSPKALKKELQQGNGLDRLRLFLLAEQTLDYILESQS
jgi:FKBP-type peptidyl-prolyl cis-trans isomerase (trigger factor)